MPKKLPGSLSEIERVHAPSREHFEQHYVKQRRPVILTGVANTWKAYTGWSIDYLDSVAGASEVAVHFDENGNFRDWYNRQHDVRQDRKMPFGELLRVLNDEPPDLRYYMTEHSLHDVSEDLVGDLSLRDYIEDVPQPGVASGPCLFVGRNTCMPMHYHPTTEAFMAQLTGTKKVTLYGPAEYAHLYPRPWYGQSYIFSQIDWDTQRAMAKNQPNHMDFERFPKLRAARPLHFTVHPGEVLFIPVHWWHVTSVEGFQLSMTWFWRSERARWHYPLPGLQVCAREAMRVSRLRLRHLGARLTGGKVVDSGKVQRY